MHEFPQEEVSRCISIVVQFHTIQSLILKWVNFLSNPFADFISDFHQVLFFFYGSKIPLCEGIENIKDLQNMLVVFKDLLEIFRI